MYYYCLVRRVRIIFVQLVVAGVTTQKKTGNNTSAVSIFNFVSFQIFCFSCVDFAAQCLAR